MSVGPILRKARKAHDCTTCGSWWKIRPGDLYLVWTAFPSDEFGDPSRPVRYKECRECATRYGRGGRFE